MINKYWVIYGLKLCLLIYYRNELFNWYQIGPRTKLIHVHRNLLYFYIPRTYVLLESNEIEFYFILPSREISYFIGSLHICILFFFNLINIDFSRRRKKFGHAETDRRWYNEFICFHPSLAVYAARLCWNKFDCVVYSALTWLTWKKKYSIEFPIKI